MNRLTIGQKRAITMEVDKCKGLLISYKAEKDQGSSLIKDTALEAHTSWTSLNVKLSSLEDNISRYNDLRDTLPESLRSEQQTNCFVRIQQVITRL